MNRPEQVKQLLDYFWDICAVPRCSGSEQAIAAWLEEWARSRNFLAGQDRAGNLLIRIPGKGEPVVLQGHLDMVCIKDQDCVHDFSKDPIRPVIRDEWITADGTTLGADNGIAIAMALAAADLEKRPELELLFTVDEERGLTGASSLQPDFVRGRKLLNLDSEDEGIITIGCAGGREGHITLPLKRTSPSKGTPVHILLNGLPGGHSGVEIHKQRPNAIRMMAMLLKNDPCTIAGISGGLAHNAIPAAAEALVYSDDPHALEFRFRKSMEDLAFYTGPEGDKAALTFTIMEKTALQPLDPASAESLLNLLLLMPHGVRRMSTLFPDLVETSANLCSLVTEPVSAVIGFSLRSSESSALDWLTEEVRTLAALSGAAFTANSGYPSWSPDYDSDLLETARQVYREQCGREAVVDVIHAGLECGVISRQIPDMEMISFGPTIREAHTPSERLHLPGLERTWAFLVALLEELT